MSRTSEEYERLRRQSELLESITGSVLNRVGLSTGMSCLDLGCGPGEVMRLMAQRVGPTGRVVGIDVTGFLHPSRVGAKMIAAVYRSVLPLALKHGVTTEERSGWFFEEIQKSESANCYMLSPLLVSAWRQKAVEDRSQDTQSQ